MVLPEILLVEGMYLLSRHRESRQWLFRWALGLERMEGRENNALRY